MNNRFYICVAFFIFFLTNCSQLDSIKFNSLKWKEWNESEATSSLRWQMSEDLLNTYEFEGKNISYVVALLGPPDSESEEEFSYFLGYSGHGIDTGSLIFYLVKNRVVDVKLWHG